jgi:2-C-methyl-D-erythritol 2,4-cyclodiphosphate synthase
MAVRFDQPARRAIDRAMAVVERHGHATLDTGHLLLGLTENRESPAAVVLSSLGTDVGALRAAVDRHLATVAFGIEAGVRIDPSLDRVLALAHERSVAAGRKMVSDVDILRACFDVPAVADSLLRDIGVDPDRLDELGRGLVVATLAPMDDEPMSAVAEFLSRAEAWTSPPPPAETTITRPEDRRSYPGLVPLIELPPRSVVTRVGNGYDSHRFEPGGPLVLGGVTIPCDVHLAGHSDGDAIAHAITDAVLGSCGAGDIGEMFADTDPANKGRDSIEMLQLAVARVHAQGWVVQQVDVTVIAEKPKILPWRAEIRVRLAEALGVTPDAVSVKGKTNEGMGWIGRGEGLACLAVATLVSAADALE